MTYSQLNPFYHTDTIALFLLLVLAASGLYLVVFHQFGYEASYLSVAKMNRFPLSWVMRGIHRYASAALMVFTLLHALRIFFQDRFRGARRPAWVWGVVMTVALWMAGITGYLLLWDERAQVVAQSILDLATSIPTLANALYVAFLSDSAVGNSWLFMLLLLGLHVGLSALGGLFFWYHIQRLSRPKLFPARTWMIGLGVLLAVLAVTVPAGLLPIANFARLPGSIPLDVVYLFYVPLVLGVAPVSMWAGIAGLVVLGVMSLAVPWILRRREPPRTSATLFTAHGLSCAGFLTRLRSWLAGCRWRWCR